MTKNPRRHIAAGFFSSCVRSEGLEPLTDKGPRRLRQHAGVPAVSPFWST
jgi:hypothetical protein